jgi:hypothetical protein
MQYSSDLKIDYYKRIEKEWDFFKMMRLWTKWKSIENVVDKKLTILSNLMDQRWKHFHLSGTSDETLKSLYDEYYYYKYWKSPLDK